MAGGAALGEALRSARVSQDVDLFHDDEASLQAAWSEDRRTLEAAGLKLSVLHERPAFVEVEAADGGARVVIQWTRDSAFRFLPLVEHPDFGLTLHPLDLATNKLLAAVGRLEVRDWVDLVESCERLQPLGYLAWAATAKDPGFNPKSIVEQAARTAHYSQAEVDALAFEGAPPALDDLSRRWSRQIESARALLPLLPPAELGKLVLAGDAAAFRGGADELRAALAARSVRFHAGRLRGAWPEVRPG